MNSKNFSSIINIHNIHGGLIGGASIKATEIGKIIRKAYLY